jgi:hypothetical protein
VPALRTEPDNERHCPGVTRGLRSRSQLKSRCQPAHDRTIKCPNARVSRLLSATERTPLGDFGGRIYSGTRRLWSLGRPGAVLLSRLTPRSSRLGFLFRGLFEADAGLAEPQEKVNDRCSGYCYGHLSRSDEDAKGGVECLVIFNAPCNGQPRRVGCRPTFGSSTR